MLTLADRDISLEDLETVLTVSDQRTFSRAAEVLSRSQPAVTRSVQSVEEALETTLLDRATRPASLTAAGEDFRYETRKGLYFIMRGFRKARCAGRGENAMLEIGHSTYLDPSVVTYLSNVAKAPNTGFSAVYHSSWSGEIVANVQAGVWDCGFVISPVSTLDLESMPVLRDPLCVVMASTHPLARRRTVQLRDLFNQRLILPSRDQHPAFRSWLAERFERAGVSPRVVQEVTHPHEGILLAAENIGVAVTNQSAAETMRKGLAAWRRLGDEDMAMKIQFVARRDARSGALAAFIHTVEKLQRMMAHPRERKRPASLMGTAALSRPVAHRQRRA
jgi:LysR family transcriptional regulator, benzoate and cis,cis-muconate-responsive activator of ben and cat genes